MDGFEVIKYLRKDEITEHLPIVMLTSKTGKEDVIKAMKLGVVDYIIKPYKYDNLSKKINAALKYGKALRLKEEIERTNHICITRETLKTIISFKSKLSNPALLKELKIIFSRAFLNMIQKDNVVLDLRTIPDFQENDIQYLENIISILRRQDLNIIAGKYYGSLVASGDLEERINLFISYGDFEIFIDSK